MRLLGGKKVNLKISSTSKNKVMSHSFPCKMCFGLLQPVFGHCVQSHSRSMWTHSRVHPSISGMLGIQPPYLCVRSGCVGGAPVTSHSVFTEMSLVVTLNSFHAQEKETGRIHLHEFRGLLKEELNMPWKCLHLSTDHEGWLAQESPVCPRSLCPRIELAKHKPAPIQKHFLYVITASW